MKPMQFMKWFYPGMRVKRWLFMAIAGVLCFGIGAALLPVEGGIALRLFSLVLLVAGLVLLVFGMMLIVRSLLEVVSPGHVQDLVDVVFQQRPTAVVLRPEPLPRRAAGMHVLHVDLPDRPQPSIDRR